MNYYESVRNLRLFWEKGVSLYQSGLRGSGSYFTPEEVKQLAALGHTPQEVYDFAEDYCNGGDPTLEDFIAVACVRLDYFNVIQKRVHSKTVIDMDKLPAKSEALNGIAWLPRILPKARAKLRGEMPLDLMYGCGGDRRFLKENNIHPAEFLRVVWSKMDDDNAIVEWVTERRKQSGI